MGIRLVENGKSIFPLRAKCPHCEAVMEIQRLSDLYDDVGQLDNSIVCAYCEEEFVPIDAAQMRRVRLEQRGIVKEGE